MDALGKSLPAGLATMASAARSGAWEPSSQTAAILMHVCVELSCAMIPYLKGGTRCQEPD